MEKAQAIINPVEAVEATSNADVEIPLPSTEKAMESVAAVVGNVTDGVSETVAEAVEVKPGAPAVTETNGSTTDVNGVVGRVTEEVTAALAVVEDKGAGVEEEVTAEVSGIEEHVEEVAAEVSGIEEQVEEVAAEVSGIEEQVAERVAGVQEKTSEEGSAMTEDTATMVQHIADEALDARDIVADTEVEIEPDMEEPSSEGAPVTRVSEGESPSPAEETEEAVTMTTDVNAQAGPPTPVDVKEVEGVGITAILEGEGGGGAGAGVGKKEEGEEEEQKGQEGEERLVALPADVVKEVEGVSVAAVVAEKEAVRTGLGHENDLDTPFAPPPLPPAEVMKEVEGVSVAAVVKLKETGMLAGGGGEEESAGSRCEVTGGQGAEEAVMTLAKDGEGDGKPTIQVEELANGTGTVRAEFSASNALKVISKGVVTERQSSISCATPVLKKQASLSVEDATISIEEGLITDRTRLLRESEEEIKVRHTHDRQDRDLDILAGDVTRKGSVRGRAEMFSKAAAELKEKTPKPLGAKKTSSGKLTNVDWTKRREDLDEHVVAYNPPPPAEDVPPPPVLKLPILKVPEATTEGADEANGAEGGEEEGGDAGEAGMLDNGDAEHKNGKDLEEVGMDMKASPDATGGGTSTNSPDLSISPLPVDGADDKDKTSGEEAKTEANGTNGEEPEVIPDSVVPAPGGCCVVS